MSNYAKQFISNLHLCHKKEELSAELHIPCIFSQLTYKIKPV